MDCLRYWVTEMHVDGFRFDLAATLGPRDGRLRLDRRRSSTLVDQDPVLSRSSSSPSRGTSARPTATTSAASRRCGRSGTAATATPCATSGAATTALLGELATRCHRLGRPLRRHAAAAPRLGQPRHRPRRVHPARPRLLRRASTTRPTARATATAPTTTGRGTAASRARRTTRTSSRCAPASRARCSPRCCSRSACRCSWAATSSAAPRAATTTPTARTTPIVLVRLGAVDTRAARPSPRARRAAPRPPGVPAAALPHRARSPARSAGSHPPARR